MRIPFYSRSCSLEGLQEGDCNRNPRLRVPQEVLVDAACTGQKPSLLAGPNLTGENMAAITQFFFRAVIAHHHDHGTHPLAESFLRENLFGSYCPLLCRTWQGRVSEYVENLICGYFS